MNTRTSIKIAIAFGSAGATDVKLFRRWYQTWGASDEEIARPVPLDDRILDPTLTTTRAITVPARPEQISPWVARLQGLRIENDVQRRR